MNRIVNLAGSPVIRSPIACPLHCALMSRCLRRNRAHNRVKRDRISPRSHPNGRSFSTPRQQWTRRSVCVSAHISFAKQTNLMRPASSMTRPSPAETILPCFNGSAASNGHVLRTVAEFIDEVLFALGLRPARLDRRVQSAVRHFAIGDQTWFSSGKAMRGGFTFKLSQLWWRPAIQVRHLSARASLIQFTHPPKRRDPRGQRKRRIAPGNRRGSFIDLQDHRSGALQPVFLARDRSPTSWKTPTRKADSGGHGKHLTAHYIGYLLARRSRRHGSAIRNSRNQVRPARPRRDTAGQGAQRGQSGQGLPQAQGVRPFREVQPDFPEHLTGLIMSTYLGSGGGALAA